MSAAGLGVNKNVPFIMNWALFMSPLKYQIVNYLHNSLKQNRFSLASRHENLSTTKWPQQDPLWEQGWAMIKTFFFFW